MIFAGGFNQIQVRFDLALGIDLDRFSFSICTLNADQRPIVFASLKALKNRRLRSDSLRAGLCAKFFTKDAQSSAVRNTVLTPGTGFIPAAYGAYDGEQHN
jgi:hypothetical protein